MLPNKVIILLGARRVGKTFLLNQLMEHYIKEPVLKINGEDYASIEIFKTRTVENYKRLLGKNKILIIDEAQKIPDIGLSLKLMVDTIEGIKIVATGSSVFDLHSKLGEPLTGRKFTFYLYPLALSECAQFENMTEIKSKLDERLIYGNYPELLQYSGNDEKKDYLNELVGSYLLKDILAFEGIRNSSKLIDLLRLIAFQIGSEVSLEELATQLMISRNTVEKYLDLLSKVFVIYKLNGFSRNLRNEITKTGKWYFFDNGIRNSLIANFNPLNLRNDAGELWENYILSERIKFQHYSKLTSNNYFWRTYQQQEIDWIEDRGGKLYAYEMKWNKAKLKKTPSEWIAAYPDSEYQVITPDNYLDWILNPD